MRRKIVVVTTFTIAAVAVAASVQADPEASQQRRLGSITFANSGSAEAQGPFIDGVLLLHSFEFEDAAAAFRRAQDIDPDFALAYWGEAMTYNHPLWREQNREAALAVLTRYAPSPAARMAKAPTEREAAYLVALDVLYGEGSKTERDLAYMAEMERLTTRYPDDLEARAFYSLAILGSTDGERDFATYMRAAAAVQPVFDANPDHPGAAHYIIHAFDDPVHAPLGLDAARAYSEIAPDAAHAQHMTSHIFVAMGMWDDVVAANIRARNVQDARSAELGRHANACGHYGSWLHYGWLMRGDIDDAERGMTECQALVTSGAATPPEISYFVAMRARHVLDTRDWEAAERLSADVDHTGFHFVTAYATLQRGDAAAATEILRTLRRTVGSSPEPRARIMILELEALLALEAGDGAGALALMEQATAIEEGLPFEFGPPASLKPPHELLGEIASAVGDHEVALAAFRGSLAFTPERTPSLEGLVAAARAVGRTTVAQDAQARLDHIRRGSH
jgi:tetratricopeptide (TPR) repeat protein